MRDDDARRAPRFDVTGREDAEGRGAGDDVDHHDVALGGDELPRAEPDQHEPNQEAPERAWYP